MADPGGADAGNVAIYWDFENVHGSLMDDQRGEGAYRASWYHPQEPVVDIDPVVDYAATFGRIVVHRAYCNWQYYGRYRDELQAHAVELVQLFPLTGSKTGADIRLVLDVAEDLERHPRLTHVVVVASDSDYTSLAQRCRRYGRVYIGIGTDRTARSYPYACDEFRRYRDLAAATASPAGAVSSAAPQPAGVAADRAPLEDAVELVTRAVRRLAADSGEFWVLKAMVRPLAKRLDPAFDERKFGFATFTDLVAALGDQIAERPGKYDHELAVRADLDGRAPSASSAPVSSTPALLIERQLRRHGLRLPDERRLLWDLPELIVTAFAGSGAGVEPGFDSLRLKLEAGVRALGYTMSEVDFNKVKWILWRGQVFEPHGQNQGIGLRVPDVGELRLRLVTVLLEHLADPSDADPDTLTEALFGAAGGDSQRQLVASALDALAERRRAGTAPRVLPPGPSAGTDDQSSGPG